MGQINKIPLGYLNMLGSQTGGKNPFNASEQVNPVVDMDPFYHAQGMAVHTDVLAYTALFDDVTREVPANEAWFLYSWGVQGAFTNSADRLRLLFAISHVPRSGTPTLAATVHSTENMQSNAATGLAGEAVLFPKPIPLVAGSQLTTTLGSKTGNNTVTISYLVAKFTA